METIMMLLEKFQALIWGSADIDIAYRYGILFHMQIKGNSVF